MNSNRTRSQQLVDIPRRKRAQRYSLSRTNGHYSHDGYFQERRVTTVSRIYRTDCLKETNAL